MKNFLVVDGYNFLRFIGFQTTRGCFSLRINYYTASSSYNFSQVSPQTRTFTLHARNYFQRLPSPSTVAVKWKKGGVTQQIHRTRVPSNTMQLAKQSQKFHFSLIALLSFSINTPRIKIQRGLVKTSRWCVVKKTKNTAMHWLETIVACQCYEIAKIDSYCMHVHWNVSPRPLFLNSTIRKVF